MCALSQIMPLGLLDEMIESGFVKRHEHSNGDLYGLNYTAAAQFERVWNDATINSRGIIVTTDGQVVARPFPKFFNLEERPGDHELYEDQPFTLFEKFDGSLGIHYKWNGQHHIATRGSFESDQAQWATDWYRKHRHEDSQHPIDGATDLYEIIYPENRVVVDYGDRRDLQFLATIDNQTGHTVRTSDPVALEGDVPSLTSVKSLYKALDTGNFEGFVALFSDGYRVKIKLDEYVRRHKIKASLTNRSIWETLSTGDRIAEIIEMCPDEFHHWIRQTEKSLRDEFNFIVNASYEQHARILNEIGPSPDRKAFAMEAVRSSDPSVQFALFDCKDISPMVWKMVRPEELRYPTC